VSYTDLQVRVYDLGESAQELETDILQRAGKEAERLTENPPPAVTEDNQGWRRLVYSYDRCWEARISD
jgi:hypothetical protein